MMNDEERAALLAGVHHRDGTITGSVRLDATARADEGQGETLSTQTRAVEIAFSSEQPVPRWFGDEVLSHAADAVRMDRMNSGAAVLVQHDHDDQVGVVESARIDDDSVGRATIRFGRSARAEEIFRDVEDGIRQQVSVGYRIHEIKLESSGDEGDRYLATDWEPFEVSIVSVPADARVGVGRSTTAPDGAPPQREIPMLEDNAAGAPADTRTDEDIAEFVTAGRDEATRLERERISGLRVIANQTPGAADMAETMIDDGRTVDDLLRWIKDEMPARATPAPEIGLTPTQARDFRLQRLIMALAYPNDRRAQEAGAFELEAVMAVPEKVRAAARGVALPAEVLRMHQQSDLLRAGIKANILSKRVLSAGGATAGAELVETVLLAQDFIDVLRNRTMVLMAGAIMLDGLQGDIAIPRKTTGSTAVWLPTETSDAGESDPAFDQVTMTPHTVGVWSSYTRQLLLQSSLAIEALLRDDLAAGVAIALDAAALYGTGATGQPLGISNTSGINASTIAGAYPTYPEIVDFETQVAVDNADIGALAYMSDATMRGSLKTTSKDSGSGMFVWESPGNTVNGYPMHVTNQVVAKDLFFGNWADLLVGAWGGLDILSDPYTGALSGQVRVVAHQSIDVAVRHPESFNFGQGL